MNDPFRWLFLATLLVNIGVSGFYRARARASETIPRGAESLAMRRLRVALGLPAFLAMVSYVAWPRLLSWSFWPLPGAWRWAGLALGLVSLLLNVWVLRSIGANISETVLTKESHQLVTKGPYRWVRHPLYSVGILLFVALALISTSWLFALFASISLVVFPFWIIRPEEAALIAKFGESYERYRERTGMLLPWLG